MQQAFSTYNMFLKNIYYICTDVFLRQFGENLIFEYQLHIACKRTRHFFSNIKIKKVINEIIFLIFKK